MANLTCENLNNDGNHCNLDWHVVSNYEYKTNIAHLIITNTIFSVPI